MLDIISLGTVSIDLYYKGDTLTHQDGRFELAIGGKYYADHFYQGLGGGGANVAMGLKAAGLNVGLIAKIGNNPFKDMIKSALNNANIHHEEYCDIEKDYINISSVLLDPKGEKTIINYRTPHQHVMTCAADFQKLDNTKAIYMANLSKVPLNERIDILSYAKKKGIMVFANLNVTDCRRPIEQILHFVRHVDVTIINSHEYADMIKVPFQSIDFHKDIVKKYSLFNEDDVLVVTDGRKGSYAYHGGKVYHEKAAEVHEVVDTTGAGDAYTAAFIASYLKVKDIEQSMQAGSKYAVKILSKIGAN
ncbi:MAG: carbohydrate kinase family protein [bacterium]|nr:carbohydrate kinase family protein [bacterium]